MKRILPLLLILLLVCGCSSSQTPAATATPAPTATVEPTAEPTATPEVTATPEPVAEATPTVAATVEAATPAPEATTISIEGTEETVEVVAYSGKNAYSMDYDSNAFALETSKGKDVFTPINANAVQGVSFTILVQTDAEYQLINAEADLQQTLLLDRYTVTEQEVPAVFADYEAKAYHAAKDGSIIDCYIIVADAGVYTLQLAYPTEAAEGFGARLWAMAETFKPVSAK